jgi:hypothetical protein
MAHFHLRSEINASATRARVFLNTARGETQFAHIFRREGFWNVQSVGGARLLPLVPHTEFVDGRERGMPMGEIIRQLRERVGSALTAPVTNAPASAPSVGA